MKYLLWSNKHEMWWRDRSLGYTGDIKEAGRYEQEEAIAHVLQSAYHGDIMMVTCLVLAPEEYEN